MNELLNQFKRIFTDDGRGDRDFTAQEERLRQAQKHLREAAAGLVRAADLLSDFLKSQN
jgi:hypothetical protein